MNSFDNLNDNNNNNGEYTQKWNLDPDMIDVMVEVPIINDKKGSFKTRDEQQRHGASRPAGMRLGRRQSKAERGFKSLRFLDHSVTGREVDAWRAIEHRFHQHAIDHRLPRDKFGLCIGMSFNFSCYYQSLIRFLCLFCIDNVSKRSSVELYLSTYIDKHVIVRFGH
ncbi:hypothetical protein IC582_027778 [Cucumis melo]